MTRLSNWREKPAFLGATRRSVPRVEVLPGRDALYFGGQVGRRLHVLARRPEVKPRRIVTRRGNQMIADRSSISLEGRTV